MSAWQRIKQSSTDASSIPDIDFGSHLEPAPYGQLRLNMFHATKSFQIFCSVLAQGALVLSTMPIPNSAHVRATPTSNAATTPNSLADILQYISAGWDSLTRAMNRCESLEDTKTGGEAVLYLPADMAVPATVGELQGHCRVRVEHLPAAITGPGQVNLSAIPAEGLLYLEHPYV